MLARLPSSWETTCPPIDGFAGTRGPSSEPDAGLEPFADALADRLRALPGLTATSLCVGDSLGGLLLLKLTLERRLFFPLYLLGPPAFGLPRWLFPSGLAVLSSLGLRILGKLPVSAAWFVAGAMSRITLSKGPAHQSLLLRMAQAANPQAARASLEALQQLSRIPLPLRPLSVPCHVARGEDDRVVRREDAERLAANVGASFEQIPSAGHSPMLESPEALAASIERFQAKALEYMKGGKRGGATASQFQRT